MSGAEIEIPAKPSRPEISASVMNFLDKATLYTALFPVGGFAKLAEKGGYKGLEWHPLRIPAGWQLRWGLVRPETKEAVSSLHQSVRSEKSLRESWRHPQRTLAMVAFLLFPESRASLKDLAQVQKVVGRKLPLVAFPNKAESTDLINFGERTFQPDPQTMELLGVNSPEELIQEAKRLGYDGFCLDLLHLRTPGKVSLNPWQKTLPLLLPHTKEIHVSAGRYDLGHRGYGIDLMKELEDLLNGTQTTDLPKMLRFIGEFGWRGRVVTEIPAAALLTLEGDGKQLKPQYLIEDHQEIVDNVVQLLGL